MRLVGGFSITKSAFILSELLANAIKFIFRAIQIHQFNTLAPKPRLL